MTPTTQAPITDNRVADACERLRTQGEKITLRNVQRLIGGSFSTLSPRYRQWQQAQSATTAHTFSARLVDALNAEWKQREEQAVAALKTQLQGLQAQCQELEHVVKEGEQRYQTLSEEAATQRQASEQRQQALQVDVQALQRQHADDQALITTLKTALKQAEQQQQAQAVKIAATQAQYEAIQAHKAWLEKQWPAARSSTTAASPTTDVT